MSFNYKPEGYNSVSIYLMADDPGAVIRFVEEVFAAEELRRYEGPDGALLHGEYRIDDSVMMIAAATPDYPAFPVWLHVYVTDVDATYQRALAAGGESLQQPTARPDDPDKRGAVKDPAGNTWWMATQKETGE